VLRRATTRKSAPMTRPGVGRCFAAWTVPRTRPISSSALKQEQLARTMFPLGAMEKPAVRELARTLGIPTAAKPDSQEICFVPNGDYAAFIDAYFREQGISREDLSGELVTPDGKVVGEHAGVHHFTVGQRRGLGVSAPEPLYVISTEPENAPCCDWQK